MGFSCIIGWDVAMGGGALALLMGFSRLCFGVHYPSDAVAGYLAAALWVSAVVLWRSLAAFRRRG